MFRYFRHLSLSFLSTFQAFIAPPRSSSRSETAGRGGHGTTLKKQRDARNVTNHPIVGIYCPNRLSGKTRTFAEFDGRQHRGSDEHPVGLEGEARRRLRTWDGAARRSALSRRLGRAGARCRAPAREEAVPHRQTADASWRDVPWPKHSCVSMPRAARKPCCHPCRCMEEVSATACSRRYRLAASVPDEGLWLQVGRVWPLVAF